MIESQLYRHRFSERELARQRAFWRPICHYLQRYVRPDGVTLDLGAGFCHFINNIRSREKIALDINEENLRRYARSRMCASSWPLVRTSRCFLPLR